MCCFKKRFGGKRVKSLLHFHIGRVILLNMQRRSTGLTMQLISLKSSFPIQDGKHSRQIEQMPQNNEIAASVNKLSVSLLQIDDADARSAQKTPAGVLFVRRGLFFVKRQRRCTVYLQKVLDTPITGNTITRHSTLDTRHSTLDTRHSTLD